MDRRKTRSLYRAMPEAGATKKFSVKTPSIGTDRSEQTE